MKLWVGIRSLLAKLSRHRSPSVPQSGAECMLGIAAILVRGLFQEALAGSGRRRHLLS